MQESQLREILRKGLPKIAETAAAGIYPMDFLSKILQSRDYLLDAQVVGSQLVYSRHIQVHSFLVMESGHIMKLAPRAFPKYDRSESPKMVVAANGEIQNTIVAKLAYLIGKMDEDTDPTITPPLVINCRGSNSLEIQGVDSLFLEIASTDVSMLFIATIQMV